MFYLHFQVELVKNCQTDWSVVAAVESDWKVKQKSLKDCVKTFLRETHTKTEYECRNVTKQHCTTLWKVNEQGEKEWNGVDGECKEVTWEECNPIVKPVTMMVPAMNCTEKLYPYTDIETTETEVTLDRLDCKVEARSVCSPVTTNKCSEITYNHCQQVNVIN